MTMKNAKILIPLHLDNKIFINEFMLLVMNFMHETGIKYVTNTIAGDTTVESNETFTITLSNPTQTEGDAEMGSNTVHTVTITNDDQQGTTTTTTTEEATTTSSTTSPTVSTTARSSRASRVLSSNFRPFLPLYHHERGPRH